MEAARPEPDVRPQPQPGPGDDGLPGRVGAGRGGEKDRRTRDLVQVQYEKGAASLLELLDAQRVWAQTRAEYLKDLHDFWLAVFQLDAAVGRT